MSYSCRFFGLAVLLSLSFSSPIILANEVEDEDIEDDFYGDDDFVSIATGTKKPIHKAPAVASVITAEDIKKMGAVTVFDIIETVLGIHVYPSNVNRMNPSYSIRGIHTPENPQTLILVNGMSTTYEYSGSRWNLFQVGINTIDRIEVIRGPGSAVYGADAFSGVINIITKGIDSVPITEFGVQTGSFQTKSSWMNHVSTQGDVKYSFNAQWFDTAGDKDRIVQTDLMHVFGLPSLSNAPGPLDTKREMYDLHAQIGYSGFRASAWYLITDGSTGAGAAQALSNNDFAKLRAWTLKTQYKWQPSPTVDVDWSLYYQSMHTLTHFVIFPAGFSTPREFDDQNNPTAFTVFTEGFIGEPIANDKYYGSHLVSHYTGLSRHNIRAEIGYRFSQGKPDENKNFGPVALDGSEDFVDGTLTSSRNTPDIYIEDQERELYFVSFQDEWQIAPDWELTAGARYDNYSDFGSTFNPRLALVWQTARNLTTKFLYGEAFRAPSFQELYSKNNPVVAGKANLQPETIRTYEVAWDYRPNIQWQIVASLYSYNAEQLIGLTQLSNGSNATDNVGNQDGYGAELEINWQPNDSLDFKFGYAWQNAEDGNNGQDIADAPGKMLDFSVNWHIGKLFNVNLDTRWILDRKRAATDNRDSIDNYNWTNLSVSYQFTDQVNAKLSVRNLFDTDAREASNGRIAEDYPLEGRGVWLNIDYTF